MQRAGWLVAGFIAGLVVAGGVFLLTGDDAARGQEQARVTELKAQVDRLESAVTKLSMLGSEPHAVSASTTQMPVSVAGAPPSKAKEKTPAQVQAIAAADAMVDAGLQSGQWTAEQQQELGVAMTSIDAQEQGRILARVSKAINDGQLHFDPRQ